MKATIFYITAMLTTILPYSNISPTWFILAAVDVILLAWCRKHISIREFARYSGYSTWYKYLKA